MKKKLLFYFALLIAPIITLFLISYSSGAGAGKTGSPLDGSNCTQCHGSNTSYNLSTAVTTNIPVGGYALGQTYAITVANTSNTTTVKQGFEITAENSTSKVGTFVITDAINTQLKGTDFVTHTTAGSSQSSWSFNWTAPSTGSGAITFYAATIAGDGTGSGNTQMVLATTNTGGVLAISEAQLLHFTMYPNPSNNQVTFQLPSEVNKAKVTVFDYLGKSLMRNEITKSNKNINISNLSTGIYFVRIQTAFKVGTKKLIVR